MPSVLHIEYADGHQRQQVVTLSSGERYEWLIGWRHGIFVPDINLTWGAQHGVSRRHARLTYDANAWMSNTLAPLAQLFLRISLCFSACRQSNRYQSAPS
jgi:hypothetical protein